MRKNKIKQPQAFCPWLACKGEKKQPRASAPWLLSHTSCKLTSSRRTTTRNKANSTFLDAVQFREDR